MTTETREQYERTQRWAMRAFWFGMAMMLTGGLLYLWKLL